MNKYFRRFTNMFVPELKDKSEHIYRYGYNNLLPQDVIRYINDSGIARRCVDKVATYIAADGFSEEASRNFKVNEKQSADDLLNEVRHDYAYFQACYYLVGRDSFGKVATLKRVPYQYVRRTLRDDYLVNMTLGTKDYKKDQNKYYPKFKGLQISAQELALQIEKYGNVGEILYDFSPTPDNPIYSIPFYYAGIEDIRTSSELQKFDLEAVLNGFVPSAILTLIGKIDNVTEDEFGKTQQDYLDETLSGFTGNVKNLDGMSNRNGLVVLNAANKDSVPVLQAFDAKAIIDAANSKRDIIGREVCRLFGVNPVLVGFSDAAVLGNTQSIANASMELNNNVNGFQRMIERVFKTCFPANDWSVTKFTPVTYIPESIYPDLTQDERRALFGFAPIVQPQTPTV